MDRLNFIVWTSGGILAGVAGKRHCHPNMAPQIIAQALLVSCRTGFSGAFRMLSISFNFCSACSQRPSATKSQTAPMSVLGHSRPSHLAPLPTNVRYAPIATKILRCNNGREVLKAPFPRCPRHVRFTPRKPTLIGGPCGAVAIFFGFDQVAATSG
jgi:hypothetical protein